MRLKARTGGLWCCKRGAARKAPAARKVRVNAGCPRKTYGAPPSALHAERCEQAGLPHVTGGTAIAEGNRDLDERRPP
jgi:hypothetical protein